MTDLKHKNSHDNLPCPYVPKRHTVQQKYFFTTFLTLFPVSGVMDYKTTSMTSTPRLYQATATYNISSNMLSTRTDIPSTALNR